MYCQNCGAKISENQNFCASCGISVSTSITSEVNKIGSITFHRVSRFVGCIIDFDVYINGQNMGILKNGGDLKVKLPIGKYKVTFSLWSGTNTQEIEITNDMPNIYAEVKLKMGFLVNKPKIIKIRSEK